MENDRITQLSEHSKLIVRDIEKEMKSAFLDYSMSVIVSRALPDVRDGLKPVHRRILYTMYEKGNDSSHAYRKSAETVGAVLGSYHPHGDASVYDAMVRLAQDFSLRYPLVDGQGNFGSVDGDSAAAYRYTEARLSKVSMNLLTDIDKDTVDFMLNFDETKQEPTVLPSLLPNLLINGSTGIAVGMATNIPPHNLNEVIDAIDLLIENKDIEIFELMECLKGPDFPTGGIIMGRSGIRSAYVTGRGKIILRARAEIQEQKNGRYHIIVTEIPYMVNKSRLIKNIADLVKEKKIEGISDINDESNNRKGMRIVIELKKDSNPQVILNQLYRYTQMQDTVGVIMIAIDNGEPKLMTLKDILTKYLDYQREVVRRKTMYELKKAEDRSHILEGLKKAIDIVDDIIATIRATKGTQVEAKEVIMEKYDFDDVQATAIVAFRLGQLAGLEIVKILNELDEINIKIENYKEVLSNDAKVLEIIKEQLNKIKEKFGDERRTAIENISGEVDIEDLIPEEDCVFTLTHFGYIKRQAVSVYQSQKRGGKGVTGLTRRDEDFVEELFVASTHDYIYFVTNQGRIHRVKGYQIMEGSRVSKGTNIVNLLQLQENEKVTSMIRVSDLENGYITMVTKAGIIKRTDISKYKHIRKTGINAISIDEGDSLAWAKITTGENELLVATRKGKIIRFKESDARAVGRTSRGVKAITLTNEDFVVGVSIAREGATLFTATDKGKGRRTKLEEYRLQNRGGKGIRNYGDSDLVAGIKIVDDCDDIMLISLEGIIIRMHAEDINIHGRYASGVRVMRLSENDVIVNVARTEKNNEAETVKPEEDNENDDENIDIEALEKEESLEDNIELSDEE